jgi:excisionase family DNA binding protein
LEKQQMKTVDGFCGTNYAAKLLGLSVGTVQGLVESNKLLAWKTQGGHRRISLQSILDYQEAHSITPVVLPHNAGRLHVMVVEDDINTQKMYQAYFERWALPLDIVVYPSAIEALLDLPALNPLVLLTDLHMADMDGFKFIKTIREHKLFSELPIIALTGLTSEAIQKEGGLNKDVLILKKPIDMEWLRGFLEGVVTLKTFQSK